MTGQDILDMAGAGQPTTLFGSTRHRLRAQQIDQTFVIDVAMPYGGAPPGTRLPVIYVTDANGAFALTVQTLRLMQMGPFALPPAIVVGIGYPADTLEDVALGGKLRFRDLSPWVDDLQEQRFRNAPPRWRLPAWIKQGGADAFLDFVENELKPFVANRYPADLDDGTIVGMSLGGLFAMHTMFAAPTAFQRYVALSPALYWGAKQIFIEEAKRAGRNKALPVHLFMSIGGLEEAHDLDCAMVSNAYAMEARLRSRNYAGFSLDFHVFPDETHMSVFAASVTRGLTAVFGGHPDIHDWAKVLKQ